MPVYVHLNCCCNNLFYVKNLAQYSVFIICDITFPQVPAYESKDGVLLFESNAIAYYRKC